MPKLNMHCYYSKKRTGNDFKDLHQWMDEDSQYLGKNHRISRHNTSYIPFVKKKWGIKGVYEFLMHISADYKSTAKKWKKEKK